MKLVMHSVALAVALALSAGAGAQVIRDAEGEPTNALSADEVRKLFSGNTELGVSMKGDRLTGRKWEAFFAEDGSFRMRHPKGKTVTGTWFIDPLGHQCLRWEHKDKTKCDFIVRDGDHYLRVRDRQLRGRFQIREGNSSKL